MVVVSGQALPVPFVSSLSTAGAWRLAGAASGRGSGA
jgi:hypothetical protein